MQCPRCEIELTRDARGGAVRFACGDCGGAALLDEDLRVAAGAERVQALFDRVAAAGTAAGCRCPRCKEPALEATIDGRLRWLRLDGCLACRLIWFDGGELADFTRQRPARARDAGNQPSARAAADMPRETTADWLADGAGEVIELVMRHWRWWV